MTLLLLALLAQQPTVVVAPPDPQVEHACIQMQQVPCDAAKPLPPPCPVIATPAPLPMGCPQPTLHWEMRNKALFWTGVALVGGGATLIVGSVTWAREDEVVGYPHAPCGTEPILTPLPVAPCRTNTALLAAGASMAGSGAVLMIYGGQHVAVGSDGRQVTVRVKF